MHIATTGYIHLTAKDRFERLQSVLLALLVYPVADVMKFLNAEHVTMICDSHPLHTVGNGLIHKFLDARLPIKDRIICMYVQMYEIFHLLCCIFCF